MWNTPTEAQLALIPELYSQDGAKDKKVYMKFFMGGWTWYILEFDKKDTFFAFVVSPMEPDGEYGYTSFSELKALKSGFVEVDRDLHSANPRKPKSLSAMLKTGG